jgi:hypothetical protein
MENLRRYVAPVADQLSEDERGPLVAALFELTLELTGLELFSRSEAVRRLWQDLFPAAAGILSERPNIYAAGMTNAVYNLEREAGADWRFWLQRMEKTRLRCATGEEWLQAGQVLAWVSGLAHFRESAQHLAERLPGDLVAELVPRWDRVKDDPWWSRRPAPGQVKAIHEVGGFVGFGGVFRRPPEVVTAGENRFLVSDGTDDWLLSCDGFGATLKRVVEFELLETRRSKLGISADGGVTWYGKTFPFPAIAPVASFDVAGPVMAVTSGLSHSVHILLGTA